MAFDLYIEERSFFHRLDPRTKMIVLLSSFILLLAARSHSVLFLLMVLLLAQGWASGGWRVIWGFRLLLLSILVLATLTRGVDAGFRMDGMILAGLFFLSSTRPEEILQGLTGLGLPFRVGFAVTVAVHLVPVIADSAQNVLLAQRSRGHEVDRGTPWARIRNHLPLIVPILVTTLRGASLLSCALEARGFGNSVPRTSYLVLRWKWVDFWVASLLFILIISSFLLKSL